MKDKERKNEWGGVGHDIEVDCRTEKRLTDVV